MANQSALQKTLRELFESQRDNLRLRDHLEGLARDESFSGLTWFWGPILYARSKPIFRSFVLQYFSNWSWTGRRWKQVQWSEHQAELDAWLAAARSGRDTRLIQQLLSWKYAAKGWGLQTKKWLAALLDAYGDASTAAEREFVLEGFDVWFDLDEPTALQLYEQDRSSGSFILRHLRGFQYGIGGRKLWKSLAQAAQQCEDTDFYFEFYRRQVPIKTWSAEVLALADRIADRDELVAELERRHPQGWGLQLRDTGLKLLESRGRDVMPYIIRNFATFLGGWFGDGAQAFVSLGERNEWWDLWAAAIRTSYNPKLFNTAVQKLLDQKPMSDRERIKRLEILAGVSHEWNWNGFGIARIHALDDSLAVQVYRHYPDLLRGPFRAHVMPMWSGGFPNLLEVAQESDDHELVDLLASCYVTRIGYVHAPFRTKSQKRVLETANSLGDYYQQLRDRDPIQFARRAANVLTRIPAFAIYQYSQLLHSNQLARLLFVRSFDAFLSVPEAVVDLLEASEIHVQWLAYRVLAQDHPNAPAIASGSLEILQGTLMRPIHRKVRISAFAALLNAARSDADVGRQVLARARSALRLPDKRYPKEELIGLIGEILHIRPELRQQGASGRLRNGGWRELMLVTLDYAVPSTLDASPDEYALALASNIRRPVRFQGEVARHGFYFRVAMRALGELIWSDDTWASAADILDPVVSVHPDRLFFEAFSRDQSAYACLVVDPGVFDIQGNVQTGTTNIDFTAWLWAALGEIRSSRKTTFRVGAEGVQVATTNAGGRFEKKVDLPDSWVRGFLQVQAAMGMPGTRVTAQPVDLLAAIRYLRYSKARVSPRALRYEFQPGEDVRLVVEPWEYVVPLLGADHNYSSRKVTRVWGRRRLKLIEGLLPFADSVDIYLKGRSLPSFYAVKLPGMTFVLGLTGWSASGFTNSGGFDLLAEAADTSDELLPAALELLRNRYHLSASELGTILSVDESTASRLLVRLCRQGRAMFDVEARDYRSRELFEEPADEGQFFPPDLRRERAVEIIAKGAVTVLSCVVEENAKVTRLKTPDGPTTREIVYRDWRVKGQVEGLDDVEVVVGNSGRIIFGRCMCPYFQEHLLNQGPCEHLLALYQASSELRHEGVSSQPADNSSSIRRRPHAGKWTRGMTIAREILSGLPPGLGHSSRRSKVWLFVSST